MRAPERMPMAGVVQAGLISGGALHQNQGMDHLAEVRAVVETWDPRDAREEAACARLLAELIRLPRPFDREADPVHVTASAIIVGTFGTVLHRHKRLGRWLQPGGHLDSGEHPAAAALREASEETGLILSHPPSGAELVHIDVHPAADGHTHLDLRYLIEAHDIEPRPSAGESVEVRWFTWDEAVAMADAALVGALRAVRARRQRPAQ